MRKLLVLLVAAMTAAMLLTATAFAAAVSPTGPQRPTPTEEVTVPDPEVPLDELELPDPEVPLDELELPDPKVPLGEPAVEIPDLDVPLADVPSPQTGESGLNAGDALVLLSAVFALGGAAALTRKKASAVR